MGNYEAEHLDFEHPVWMDVVELAFLTWYGMELFVKLGTHRLFFFWCDDMGWNIFDFLVIGFSILGAIVSAGHTGSGVVRSLRIMRLVKALRVLRVMRFFN